jgi:biopolymer transport protein ExbD
MLTSTMVTTNALDLVPKAKGKQTAIKISVSINKELQFFIDKEPVSETELESKLLAMLANDKTKAIILRAEGVPIEKAVNVLDIANRNQIKVVLAVRPK